MNNPKLRSSLKRLYASWKTRKWHVLNDRIRGFFQGNGDRFRTFFFSVRPGSLLERFKAMAKVLFGYNFWKMKIWDFISSKYCHQLWKSTFFAKMENRMESTKQSTFKADWVRFMPCSLASDLRSHAQHRSSSSAVPSKKRKTKWPLLIGAEIDWPNLKLGVKASCPQIFHATSPFKASVLGWDFPEWSRVENATWCEGGSTRWSWFHMDQIHQISHR